MQTHNQTQSDAKSFLKKHLKGNYAARVAAHLGIENPTESELRKIRHVKYGLVKCSKTFLALMEIAKSEQENNEQIKILAKE